MRILHITPEAPGYCSGGRLGVLQTKESIVCDDNIVDYVGPFIEDGELRSGYRNLYFLEKNKNPIKLILNLLKGITNKSYDSWSELNLDYNRYNAIVLDFTKQDYILKKIDCQNLYVRVHNVEYDFSNRAFQLNRTIKNYIFKRLSYNQENTLLKVAKLAVALTENDKARLIDLYGIKNEKIDIVPVCTKSNHPVIKNNVKTMIITGSLWFGGNFEGIKWFINEVFNKLDSSYQLIIAGSKPNDELKKMVDKCDNIELAENPTDMGEHFAKASIAIAPVFDGAGMKVKIAEAFSYGLPVIATDHALTGYDIEDGINSYRANTPEEFVKAINAYFMLSDEEILKFRNRALILHDNKYSLKQSRILWKHILKGN